MNWPWVYMHSTHLPPPQPLILDLKKKKKRQTALGGKRRGLHMDTLPLFQASTTTYKEVSPELLVPPLGKEGQGATRCQ